MVYILSNGRSGSTLLDLLLGSVSNVWTVGEAQLLPFELRENRSPCGCGRTVTECPFWMEVVPRLALEEGKRAYGIGYFRDTYGAGRVLRWRLLPELLTGRDSGDRESVRRYGRANATYLDEVREKASAHGGAHVRWLVDASKDPYRLMWLNASDFFELRVIHLTKAPAAFVYSMVRPELPGGLGKTARMAGRWLVENALMLRLCRTAFPRNHVRHVRYRDLAGRPREVLEMIGEWLDLDVSSVSGRSLRTYENHALSGNKMRWEDTEVRLDERWKDEFPAVHRRLVRLVARPLASSLGY